MVFLTGGTGLLGIRLLFDLISSGKEVRALKRKSSELSYVQKAFLFYDPMHGQSKFEKINWIEGDVLDTVSLQNGMKGCKEVYHAAAMVSFHQKDRDEMLEININGTANVVNVAVELNCEKFCHISSIAALGRQGKEGLISENDLWTAEGNPSNYAISKHYSELEVWRGMEEGLNAVILCPSLILGAGRPNLSSGKIYSAVWNGLKYCGPNSSSIIDARTISSTAIQLMEKQIWKERFILSAHNLPSKELFDTVAESLKKKGPKDVLSVGQIKFSVSILKLLAKLKIEPKVSFEMVQGGLMNVKYDNSKLSKFLPVVYPSAKTSIAYYSTYYSSVFR